MVVYHEFLRLDGILSKPPIRLDIGSTRIPGIDGWRAVSIILVILAHYGFGNWIPGGLGVTTFFFISGFLITTLMLREAAATGTISIKHFFARRLLRLQPELLTFIILSGFLGIVYIGLPPWKDFLAAFGYYSNYYQLLSLSADPGADIRWPHLWSLAVEEHFYLTFPFFFIVLYARAYLFFTVLTAICFSALVWRCFILTLQVDPHYTYIATDARMDSIAYGSLGALFLWHIPKNQLALQRFAPAFLVAGVALIALSLFLRDHYFRESFRYSFQGLALMLIFISMFTWRHGQSLMALFDLALLRFIGRISYAAYLWHLEPIHVLSNFINLNEIQGTLSGKVFLVIIAGAMTLLVAYLSHCFIYSSVRSLRKRLGSQDS
jgi:peptidoglycan/LPS O-acetylase OafA/YrhL